MILTMEKKITSAPDIPLLIGICAVLNEQPKGVREGMLILTVPQARKLLISVLPKQVFDAGVALEALSRI